MKRKKALFLLSTLFVCSETSLAAGSDLQQYLAMSLDQLMNVKVRISTDTDVELVKAPSLVTVITQEDIRLTGATNIADILEGVPGLHVFNHPFVNRPQPHFRGAKGSQTLIMVNGNSMRDLFWSYGAFWKGMPVSNIERIEIIRGPGSALFGADASAGVINIITKVAGKIEKNGIGIRAGSFNERSLFAQHGASINGFDLGLTAELAGTDGHDPYIRSDGAGAAGTANYGWDNLNIGMSLARGDWRLQMAYQKNDDIGVGLTGALILDPTTRADDNRLNADLLYNNENFSDNWGLEAELRFQDYRYSSGQGFQEQPAGFTMPAGAATAVTGVTADPGIYIRGLINRMQSAEHKIALEVSGLYSGIENHKIKLGSGFQWQELYKTEQWVNFGVDANGARIARNTGLYNLSDSPYVFAPEKRRENAYLFVQDIWSLSQNWELTAGLRYDDYSDFGETLNPRLSLVWNTTGKLTTKLLYGEAFRSPSYLELYALTSRSTPNSSLDPEQSATVDLVFNYRASPSLQLDLNLFHYEQDNLIGTDASRQYQNLGNHLITGMELEARWQITNEMRLTGNYTTRDQDDTGYRDYSQPDEDTYVRFDWAFSRGWNWNLQGNWIGERKRRATDVQPINDYFITDTTLHYNHTDNWEWVASIRNLFDEDAYGRMSGAVGRDLPLPERSAWMEIRYSY